jgi:hypothetical protein
MELDRRRLLLLLALTAVVVAAAALILKGALPGGGESPLPTFTSRVHLPLAGQDESPLGAGTPGPSDDGSASLWPGAAAALLWVAMGLILALALWALIRRIFRRAG